MLSPVKQQYAKIELILPDGTYLKSRKVFERGGRFWRTYSFTSDALPKLKLPLYCSFTSGEYHVACIDIDVLPPGYDSYGSVAADLMDLPGVTACPSPSGKVKGFILIKNQGVPPINLVASMINDLLPAKLKGKFDSAGLKYFLCTETMGVHLTEWLASGPAFFSLGEAGIGADTRDIDHNRNSPLDTIRSTYKEHEGPLPAHYAQFVNCGRKGAKERERFCRILIATFGLLDAGGWSLPQDHLGKYLGVPGNSVGRWLKVFQANGWLTKVSNSYIVGLRAIKYTAGHELRSDIQARKDGLQYVRVLPMAPPKDGEYYKYLLNLSNRMPSYELYQIAVDSIPGMNDNRKRLSKYIWDCKIRKERAHGKNR